MNGYTGTQVCADPKTRCSAEVALRMPALRPGAREVLRTERSYVSRLSKMGSSSSGSSSSKPPATAESAKGGGKRANPAAVYAAPEERAEEGSQRPSSPLIAPTAARGEGARPASAD